MFRVLARSEKGQKQKVKHVVMLLDMSGSMMEVRDATLESTNGYIDSLKGEEDVSFSLVTFDTQEIKAVFAHKPMSKVKHITGRDYHPRSGTPLYDAVGRTIKDLESRLGDEEEPAVLFTIITDGLENSSQAYTVTEIKTLIEERQGRGWTFTYLGANQDAWEAAGAMGVPQGNAVRYSSTPRGHENLRQRRAESTREWLDGNVPDGAMYAKMTTPRGWLKGDESAEEDKEEDEKPIL